MGLRGDIIAATASVSVPGTPTTDQLRIAALAAELKLTAALKSDEVGTLWWPVPLPGEDRSREKLQEIHSRSAGLAVSPVIGNMDGQFVVTQTLLLGIQRESSQL